jgi:hypothetical protein
MALTKLIVCFYKRKPNGWLRRLLKKDFGSVGVIRFAVDPFSDGTVAIGINNQPDSLDVIVIRDTSDERLKKFCTHAIEVNCYPPIKGDKLRFWTTPIRCVAVTKLVLGIHDWRVMTPEQLYRYLLDGKAEKFGIDVIREI